jgi:hypothetical protein
MVLLKSGGRRETLALQKMWAERSLFLMRELLQPNNGVRFTYCPIVFGVF